MKLHRPNVSLPLMGFEVRHLEVLAREIAGSDAESPEVRQRTQNSRIPHPGIGYQRGSGPKLRQNTSTAVRPGSGVVANRLGVTIAYGAESLIDISECDIWQVSIADCKSIRKSIDDPNGFWISAPKTILRAASTSKRISCSSSSVQAALINRARIASSMFIKLPLLSDHGVSGNDKYDVANLDESTKSDIYEAIAESQSWDAAKSTYLQSFAEVIELKARYDDPVY